MHRSELKKAEPAVDMMLMRAHAAWSLYVRSTASCDPHPAARPHARRPLPPAPPATATLTGGNLAGRSLGAAALRLAK